MFEKSFTFNGDCVVAWLCGCFPLGQIASKLRTMGTNYCLGYQGIVYGFLLLCILDSIFGSSNNPSTGLSGAFIAVVVFQLRRLVRAHFGISGSCLSDGLASIICGPCAIIQMVHQLWEVPENIPGWDTSEAPAMLP